MPRSDAAAPCCNTRSPRCACVSSHAVIARIPDVFVLPLVDGRRPRRFDEVSRLVLAVEILSTTTARADRVAKRTLFREEGVLEYWVVDLDARTIERSTPADARVDVLDARIQWRPEGALTSLSIDLADYFRRVIDD